MKFLGFTLALLSANVLAAPDLAATLHYHSQTTGSDGVSVQREYRERFVRQGDMVWRQRLVPEPVEASETREPAHDHGPDLNRLGRWLERQQDGALRLRFIDTEHQQLIEAQPGDWSAVGFDGRWPESYYLLPPTVLAQLDRIDDTTYQRRHPNGDWLKVTWSDTLQMPLQIESGNASGRYRATIRIVPEALPEPLPWAGVARFEQKDYTDLLD